LTDLNLAINYIFVRSTSRVGQPYSI